MYSAYITTIHSLRKHSNADRLQCTTVFGNNVIVDMSYKEGDRVIFFPVDGQLDADFAEKNNLLRKKNEKGENIGGYLDPNKCNIMALKLRGEKSEGLVLPIEVLSDYTDINKLSDGDSIVSFGSTTLCQKYIPHKDKKDTPVRSKCSKKKNVLNAYPFFTEHVDTAQLCYNEKAFKTGDTCYITLKMHGTSGRTANTLQLTHKKPNLFQKLLHLPTKTIKKYEIISGTRRTILESFDGGFYGNNEFRKKYHDFFATKLPKGMEVYYEIVGYIDNTNQTIMGKCSNDKIKDKEFSKKYGKRTIFHYGNAIGYSDCYIYRMTMTNEDGYTFDLPWEQVQIEAERMGCKVVPTFDKFIFTTWEDLMARVEKYYDGADPIGLTHIREGVVVRIDNRKSFTAFKHKNFYFKVLEGIIKNNADAPDMEEAEEVKNDE